MRAGMLVLLHLNVPVITLLGPDLAKCKTNKILFIIRFTHCYKQKLVTIAYQICILYKSLLQLVLVKSLHQ